jgi:tRNA A-37 threonylcarbamoyl transferase component Bud32
MSIYTKRIPYTDKHNKGKICLEVEIQRWVHKYGFTPEIYDVDFAEDECIICMEDLEEQCLADKYGDLAEHIPAKYWEQIRTILAILFEREGIEYIDITPYNFIEKNDKIYIIDFGDAYYTHKSKEVNWFLKEVLDGHNGWNPDFK